MLLDFCASRHREALKVASIFFQHKTYGTWYHSSSKKWYQLDHMICGSKTMGLVQDVKVMPGYVHDTDHRFLKLVLSVPHKAALGKYYRNQADLVPSSRPPRLLVGALQDPEVAEDFNLQLHDLMSEGLFDEGYHIFGHALRVVGEKRLGVVPLQNAPEWKIQNHDRLCELSELKRAAAESSPEGVRSKQYKALSSRVKKETRAMLNKWWKDKAAAIQAAVDSKDHNYQFAGYRELRKLLCNGRKQATKLKAKNGELIPTRTGDWTDGRNTLRNS